MSMHPFMRQISITYRCAMQYREKELADTGLAGCQTPYLTALYRHPGQTQEELARALDVNKSTVTRQLCCLEEKGYIRREADPGDRRSLRVYPTEKALALKERLYRCLRGWSAYLTQDLSPEEQAALSGLMARIADRADRYVKGECDPCAPSDNT